MVPKNTAASTAQSGAVHSTRMRPRAGEEVGRRSKAMVRRLGRETHDFPSVGGTHVAHAIVESIWPAPPELDRVRCQSVAAPVGGTRHVTSRVAASEHAVP